MPELRFRAVAPEMMLAEPLDVLTAVYHRPSGATHLLAEPAPEIVAALANGPLTLQVLLTRLGDEYALGDADTVTLAARLDELVAAGLAEAV